MSPKEAYDESKSIKGTHKSGEAIRSRRQELGLAIEETAFKASVGVKSRCRYEPSESILEDKAKGICKALYAIVCFSTNPDFT